MRDFTLGLVFAFATAACSSPTAPQVGSETHWLRSCGSAQDCGGGLQCVCGACTRRCSGDDACAGDGPAACYDRGSPLLLERCGSAPAGELSAGICLRECAVDLECRDSFACVEGACVPRIVPDAPDAATAGFTPDELDALLTMDPPIDRSTPVQTPVLKPQIVGGDGSLTGTWVQADCDPANPEPLTPWGCVRLTFVQGAQGDVTGTLQIERADEVFGDAGIASAPPGGFLPAEDPDVGYPPGVPPESFFDIAWNFPAGVPYRVLDGRFDDGALAFSWSLLDLWHDWCSLQTSYRWTIGDHAFSFCVPQDRTLWSSIDEAKVVLCTSADFAPLCSLPNGELLPCLCVEDPGAPDCSFAYCRCDDLGCDADVHLALIRATFAVDGDTMVGGFRGLDSWTATLRRSTP